MRSLLIGLAIGLILAGAIIFVLQPTDPTGNVATLPADHEAVEADFVIEAGDVSPLEYRVASRSSATIVIHAKTGPARLIFPDAGVATPVLSPRQLMRVHFTVPEPGEYELFCDPCGRENTLERITLIAE